MFKKLKKRLFPNRTKTVTLEIGVWDMDSKSNGMAFSVGMAHWLSITEWDTIRNAEVWIVNDSETGIAPLSIAGSIALIDYSGISLIRDNRGMFDNKNFSSLDLNRGYITFTYLPD